MTDGQSFEPCITIKVFECRITEKTQKNDIYCYYRNNTQKNLDTEEVTSEF